jgi:hypothetical protein
MPKHPDFAPMPKDFRLELELMAITLNAIEANIPDLSGADVLDAWERVRTVERAAMILRQALGRGLAGLRRH